MNHLITLDEIETSRTPSQSIRWFETYLEKTAIDRRFKKEILLKQDIAKVIYEEVFPIYRMLQVFGKRWNDLRFKNVIGNQNYDVEVVGDGDLPFRFIEITVADLGHEELLRMKYFLEHGRVPVIGKVTHIGTKRTGHTISVSDDLRLHADVNREKKEGIGRAIARKAEKDYPEDGGAIFIL